MEKEASFCSGTGNTFEYNFWVRPNASHVVPADLKFRAVPIYR